MSRQLAYERRIRFTNELWQKIEPALPIKKAGRPGNNDRNFIEAIYFRYRTGISWRDLPPDFGPWKTIYNRFNDWGKKGFLMQIFEATKKNNK